MRELEDTKKVKYVAAACPVVGLAPAGAWGQSPASLWVGRPCGERGGEGGEAPAGDSTPWSLHSHDAAGTSTGVLAVRGTLPSPARDAGSHGLEMPPTLCEQLCGAQYPFGLCSTCSCSTRELLDPVSSKDTLTTRDTCASL